MDRAVFWQQMLNSYEQRNLELAAKQRRFRDTLRNMKAAIPTDLLNEDMCRSSSCKNPHVSRLAPIPESCTSSVCAMGQSDGYGLPGWSNRPNLASYGPHGYDNVPFSQSPGFDMRVRPDFSQFSSPMPPGHGTHVCGLQSSESPNLGSYSPHGYNNVPFSQSPGFDMRARPDFSQFSSPMSPGHGTHVCGLQSPESRDVCQKFETMNSRLSEKFKVISNDIRSVKLELRNCMNQLEAPCCLPKAKRTVTLQTEPPKYSHRQEQTGPVCECTDFDDAKESLHQLTEDMQLLQCSCEELLEDLKQKKQEPKYDICTKCAQGDHELVSMDNSLYGLARQLSKTLLEMETCAACKKVCPDVKDTVGYLKYLLDMLHKLSERKAKPCPSARLPRPPPPPTPPKPCPCVKDAPRVLPPPPPPSPPPPPPPKPCVCPKGTQVPDVRKVSKEVGPSPPPPPAKEPCVCHRPNCRHAGVQIAAKTVSTGIETEAPTTTDTQLQEVEPSAPPPPTEEPCVCHRPNCQHVGVQIGEEGVSTGIETEAPTTTATEVGSTSLLIIEGTVQAEEHVSVEEISLYFGDQEDNVKETTTASETEIEINIDDDTDINVTFSIDDEGQLREVRTEGPDGIVDSTLSYTESGNVTITTEVIDYMEEDTEMISSSTVLIEQEVLDATSEDIESLTTEMVTATSQEESKRTPSQQQEHSMTEAVDKTTSITCKDICRQRLTQSVSKKQECAYLRSLYAEQSASEYDYDESTKEGLYQAEGFETISIVTTEGEFGEETIIEETEGVFDQEEGEGITMGKKFDEFGKELDVEGGTQEFDEEVGAKGEYGEETATEKTTVTEKESEGDYGKDAVAEGIIARDYDEETITEKASKDAYGQEGTVARDYDGETITEKASKDAYGQEGTVARDYDKETITEKASDAYGKEGITEGGVAGVYGKEEITKGGVAGVYDKEEIIEKGVAGAYGKEAMGEIASESDYSKEATRAYDRETMAEKESAGEFVQRGGEVATEKASTGEFDQMTAESISITEKESELTTAERLAAEDVYGKESVGVSETLSESVTEKESVLGETLTGATAKEELESPSMVSSATIEEIEGISTQKQISSITFMSVSEVDQQEVMVGESESLEPTSVGPEEDEKRETFEEAVEIIPTSIAESEATIYEESEATEVSEAEVSAGVGVEEIETLEAKVGIDTVERGVCVDICKERAESAVHVVPSPVDIAEKGVCSDICKTVAERSAGVQSSTTDMVEKGICVDVCKKLVNTGISAVSSTEIYTTNKEVCVDICKKRFDTGMNTVSSDAIDIRGVGVCTDICRQMLAEPPAPEGVCSDICKRQAEAVTRASIRETAICADICRQLIQAPTSRRGSETPRVCSDVCKQITKMLDKGSGTDVLGISKSIDASEERPTKEIGVCTDICKEMAETSSSMINSKDVGVCTDICKQLSEAQLSAVPSTVEDMKEEAVCTDICRQFYQESMTPSTPALEEGESSEVGIQPERLEESETLDLSLQQEVEGTITSEMQEVAQAAEQSEAETLDLTLAEIPSTGASGIEEGEAVTSEKTEATDEGLLSEAVTGTAEVADEGGRLETITELTETEGGKLEQPTDVSEITGKEAALELEEGAEKGVQELFVSRGIEETSEEDMRSALPGADISSPGGMAFDTGELAGKDEITSQEYGFIAERGTAESEQPLAELERATALTEEERLLAVTGKPEALTEEEQLLADTRKAEALTEEERLLVDTGKAEALTEEERQQALTEEEQRLAETEKAEAFTLEEELLSEMQKTKALAEEESRLSEMEKASVLTEEELLAEMEKAGVLAEEGLSTGGVKKTHSELVREGADYWKGAFEEAPPLDIERPSTPMVRESGSEHPCKDVCGRLYRQSGQTVSGYAGPEDLKRKRTSSSEERRTSRERRKKSSVEKKASYMDISCAYLQSVQASKKRRSTKDDRNSTSPKRPSRKSADQEKKEVPTVELYVEPSDVHRPSTSEEAQSDGEKLPADFFDNLPKPHPPDCDCFDCLCATCPDLQGICTATMAKSKTSSLQEMDKEMTPEEKQLHDNIKVMDQSDLEKHIQETEEQYIHQKDQMMKLKDKIDAVRCMCDAAEVLASDSNPLLRTYAAKQKSAFHLTMSGLNLALSTLKNKCKQQDHVIETIAEELKLRTSKENADDLLEKLGVQRHIRPSKVFTTSPPEKQVEESSPASSGSTRPSSASYTTGEMPEMLFPLFKSLLNCPHSNFPHCDCATKAALEKPELRTPTEESDRKVKRSKEETKNPSFAVVSQSKLAALHEICSCTRPKCPIKTHISRGPTPKSAPKTSEERPPKHPCLGRKDLTKKDRSPTRPQTASMPVDVHPKSRSHSLVKPDVPTPFAVCKKLEAARRQPLPTVQGRERSSSRYRTTTGQFSASTFVSGVQKMASIRKECAEKAPRTSQYLARYQKEGVGVVEHGSKKRQASCSRGGYERSSIKSSEADVARAKPAASKYAKKYSR